MTAACGTKAAQFLDTLEDYIQEVRDTAQVAIDAGNYLKKRQTSHAFVASVRSFRISSARKQRQAGFQARWLCFLLHHSIYRPAACAQDKKHHHERKQIQYVRDACFIRRPVKEAARKVLETRIQK